MAKHKCIYCLQEKDESAFNREHVVPRMMGTYQNGYVLSNYEVCEECNSYFSRELEDKIGLNSMEGFLRMQHGRTMSDGRMLRGDRVSFKGTDGIFNGLDFIPVVDNQNPERIHFDILPRIGILADAQSEEYNYYEAESLPKASPETLARLRGKEAGIVTVGMTQEEAIPHLKDKGYLDTSYAFNEVSVKDLYKKADFTTKITASIDSIVRRTCAKVVLNYLCYSKGKDFVLSDDFNDIRNYIRYGKWSDSLWFRYSQGPVTSVEMPNDTAHVVGYMWFPEKESWILCGCLTWFGETTYVFKLGETEHHVSLINMLPSTKMACFDNDSRTIIEDEAIYLFAPRK